MCCCVEVGGELRSVGHLLAMAGLSAHRSGRGGTATEVPIGDTSNVA